MQIATNGSTKRRGFTIVELLVVITVIGVLAAITIISYTGITARANAASGKSAARSALAKVSAYSAEGPTGNWPTSYGSIDNAEAGASYKASGLDWTTASGNTSMSAFRPSFITVDSIDFQLCGTNTSAAATSYATVNVLTGVRVGYWDYSLTTPAENLTNASGSTSGNWSNGYAINCYKVGLAEAGVAVAKALYSETGTYPATAAAINANTATTAKLPYGVTVIRTGSASLNAGNGQTTVYFECGTAVAATLPCNNTGGRFYFWNYSTGAVGVTPVTFGTATNFAAPAS